MATYLAAEQKIKLLKWLSLKEPIKKGVVFHLSDCQPPQSHHSYRLQPTYAATYVWLQVTTYIRSYIRMATGMYVAQFISFGTI